MIRQMDEKEEGEEEEEARRRSRSFLLPSTVMTW